MVTRKSFRKSGRKASMSVLDGVGAYGGQTYARIPELTHRGHIAIAPPGLRLS